MAQKTESSQVQLGIQGLLKVGNGQVFVLWQCPDTTWDGEFPVDHNVHSLKYRSHHAGRNLAGAYRYQ